MRRMRISSNRSKAARTGAAIRSSACRAGASMCCAAHTLSIEELGEIVETRELADPLAEIEKIRATYKVPQARRICRHSPAASSAISVSRRSPGSNRVSPRAKSPIELGTPDALLMLSEEVAVFDNLKGRLYLIVHADPARAAGVCARAAPARRARVSPASFGLRLSRRARSESARGNRFRLDVHARGIRGARREGEGIHPRRRHLPGRALAAPVGAVSRAAGRRLSRTARAESVAVHVFPRSRQDADRRLVAGDSGAAQGRQGRRAADRRHAPARQDARRGSRARSRSCSPMRKSAPST